MRNSDNILVKKNKEKISVVVHTYNAESFLDRVLESIKDFDEIIICDMYSTDNTIEIAKQHNCRIIYHKNVGFVEPARNFAIQSALFDWVLIVDADELITKGLRAYLYNQIKRTDCPCAIKIPRKNFFMGRFLHSSYPDYVTRFVKKDSVVWPSMIHSEPIINGKVEKINSRRMDLALIHLANDSLETILYKTNIYIKKEAEKKRGITFSKWSLITIPLFRFFKSYILKGGFRDGKAGLAYAGINAMYKFTIIIKVWENSLSKNNMDKDLFK